MVRSFGMAVLFAFVLGAALIAQAPPESPKAEASARIYDVRDMLRKGADESEEDAINIEDFAAFARDAGGLAESAVKVGSGRSLLVITANDAAHEAVQRAFENWRKGRTEPYSLLVISGRLVTPIPGLDTAAGDVPVALVDALAGIDIVKPAVRSAGDPLAAKNVVVRFEQVKLHFAAENGKADSSASVENGWVGRIELSPLTARTLDFAKTRKFVTGYRVERDVEGHPDGLAVPEITTVKDGLTIRAVVVPEPTGDPKARPRVKLTLKIEESTIAPEIKERSTPEGMIRTPTVSKRTTETSIILEKDRPVAFPLGQNGAMLFVKI